MKDCVFVLASDDPDTLDAVAGRIADGNRRSMRIVRVPYEGGTREDPPGGAGFGTHQVPIRAEHLYKFAGLLFMLALLYRFFDEVTRVLLVAFAAAILAVVFNAVIRSVPGERKWLAALIGLLIVGAGLWFGIPVLFKEVRQFAASAPQIERELAGVSQSIQEHTGLDVNLIGGQATDYARRFAHGMSGQEAIGRARGVLEYLLLPVLVFFGALICRWQTQRPPAESAAARGTASATERPPSHV